MRHVCDLKELEDYLQRTDTAMWKLDEVLHSADMVLRRAMR